MFPECLHQSFGGRQGAGVKRMHVLSYLISCGFQRGVPRIIGRAIRGTLSNGAKIIDVFRAKLELDMKITHAVHTQILCGFQSHYPPNSKSPSWNIGPRCSPKACIQHSGNAQVEVHPGRDFCTAPQVLAGGTVDSEEKREVAKERLLGYHDRQTGGIPGLLPLVPNLPVRFTDALGRGAKEQGVFKHTRGILRGWELPEEENERVKLLMNWEHRFAEKTCEVVH